MIVATQAWAGGQWEVTTVVTIRQQARKQLIFLLPTGWWQLVWPHCTMIYCGSLWLRSSSKISYVLLSFVQ